MHTLYNNINLKKDSNASKIEINLSQPKMLVILLNPLEQFEINSFSLANFLRGLGVSFKLYVSKYVRLLEVPITVELGNPLGFVTRTDDFVRAELEYSFLRYTCDILRNEAIETVENQKKLVAALDPVALENLINIFLFAKQHNMNEDEIDAISVYHTLNDYALKNYFLTLFSFNKDPVSVDQFCLHWAIGEWQNVFSLVYGGYVPDDCNYDYPKGDFVGHFLSCLMDNYFIWKLLNHGGLPYEFFTEFDNPDDVALRLKEEMGELEKQLIEGSLFWEFLQNGSSRFLPELKKDFFDTLADTAEGIKIGNYRVENTRRLYAALEKDNFFGGMFFHREGETPSNTADANYNVYKVALEVEGYEDNLNYTGWLLYSPLSSFAEELEMFVHWYESIGSTYYSADDIFGLSIDQHLYFLYCRSLLLKFFNSDNLEHYRFGNELTDIMMTNHLREIFISKIKIDKNMALDDIMSYNELQGLVNFWQKLEGIQTEIEFDLFLGKHDNGLDPVWFDSAEAEEMDKEATKVMAAFEKEYGAGAIGTYPSSVFAAFANEYAETGIFPKKKIVETVAFNAVTVLPLTSFIYNDWTSSLFFGLKNIFLFLDVYVTSELLAIILIFVLLSVFLTGLFNIKEIGFLKNFLQYGSELISFIRTILLETLSHRQLFMFVMLYSVFLIILFGNTLGLIPFPTVLTAQLLIALILALVSFIATVEVGIIFHKNHFIEHFLPEGTPVYIAPFLLLIEFISYFSRVISLAVRLFANITAGHTLLKILAIFAILLISNLSISILLVSILLPFLLIILTLEIMIAFLQSYVFFILFVVYLQEVR